MAAPRHEKGLGENNFCVLEQQAGRPQRKSRAISGRGVADSTSKEENCL